MLWSVNLCVEAQSLDAAVAAPPLDVVPNAVRHSKQRYFAVHFCASCLPACQCHPCESCDCVREYSKHPPISVSGGDCSSHSASHATCPALPTRCCRVGAAADLMPHIVQYCCRGTLRLCNICTLAGGAHQWSASQTLSLRSQPSACSYLVGPAHV